MKLSLPLLVSLAGLLPHVAADGWSLGPYLLSSFLQDDEYPLTPFLRRPSSTPKYEVVDNEEKFQVALDVPGVKMEDIDVHLDENGKYLVISGHREASGDTYTFSSRFSQSFSLDHTVEVENFHADLKNGVLVVSAPKNKSRANNRVLKIPINAVHEEIGDSATPSDIAKGAGDSADSKLDEPESIDFEEEDSKSNVKFVRNNLAEELRRT